MLQFFYRRMFCFFYYNCSQFYWIATISIHIPRYFVQLFRERIEFWSFLWKWANENGYNLTMFRFLRATCRKRHVCYQYHICDTRIIYGGIHVHVTKSNLFYTIIKKFSPETFQFRVHFSMKNQHINVRRTLFSSIFRTYSCISHVHLSWHVFTCMITHLENFVTQITIESCNQLNLSTFCSNWLWFNFIRMLLVSWGTKICC